jgi:hypothetical protein
VIGVIVTTFKCNEVCRRLLNMTSVECRIETHSAGVRNVVGINYGTATIAIYGQLRLGSCKPLKPDEPGVCG